MATITLGAGLHAEAHAQVSLTEPAAAAVLAPITLTLYAGAAMVQTYITTAEAARLADALRAFIPPPVQPADPVHAAIAEAAL